MSNPNYQQADHHIKAASHIVIIQAENPDGDSLGSALALEAILNELGKKVTLFCAIEVPKYLRYIKGWDRVTDEFPQDADLTVIVDTASSALMEKALAQPNLSRITAHPVIVIDHHATQGDLQFEHAAINDAAAVATGEMIYYMAKELAWPLPQDACDCLLVSILADTLGLVTEAVGAKSVLAVAGLLEGGAKISDIENRRREFMKKSPEILAYKGRLLQRVEYHLDGALALVHIPFDEIHEFSNEYNPSVLVLDEMRLVEGVRVAVAIKTYPDGKLTGKLRTNPDAKVAETVAAYFGGGGHGYAAGFKVYGETLEQATSELAGAVSKALQDYDKTK